MQFMDFNAVGETAVGKPPKKKIRLEHQVGETLVFHVHDWKSRRDLPPGQSISMPSLKAYGLTWRLRVYPKGFENAEGRDQVLSLALNATDMRYTAVCQDSHFVYSGEFEQSHRLFFVFYQMEAWNCGSEFDDPVVAACLNEHGTLDISVGISKREWRWYPQKIVTEPTLVHLFMSRKGTDVVFQIGSRNFEVSHIFV